MLNSVVYTLRVKAVKSRTYAAMQKLSKTYRWAHPIPTNHSHVAVRQSSLSAQVETSCMRRKLKSGEQIGLLVCAGQFWDLSFFNRHVCIYIWKILLIFPFLSVGFGSESTLLAEAHFLMSVAYFIVEGVAPCKIIVFLMCSVKFSVCIVVKAFPGFNISTSYIRIV